MKKLNLFLAVLVTAVLLGCRSNTDKEQSSEPYQNYDTTVKQAPINTPNPDSVKSIGSPGDDQHH